MQDNRQLIGNRYQLADKLGAGNMGVVYRAIDRLTGNTIALKRVTVSGDQLRFASQGGSSDFRFALANEFQTLASLHHPHIISVLDYGFDVERQPYFTMSLLENSRTIVQAGEDATDVVRVRLLVEMLQALAYLHRRGIIHRDLKPGNVLVDSGGQVKVLDFGLAAERQREGETVGTLAYMAPEIMQEQAATNASDLYAVGVMAYELFAGCHPFDHENSGVMIMQIFNDKPDLSPLPDDINDIVGKLLEKDPADRYQEVYAVIKDLSEAVGQAVPEESVAIRDSFLQAAKFVGRNAELEQLSDALDSAMSGKGSAWLIGGESGVGKSRLVDELRTKAMVKGALVLRGQGVAEGGLPYQLWRDPLRRLILSTELSDLETSVLKELVSDVGDLLGRDVADAPELEGEAQQQRLMLTGVDVFRRQKQPVVLLLEDLQWARESLEPLKQFSRIIGELPLLVIGSYRDDERPDLPEKLTDMQMMSLSRLSPEEMAELSESMLGEAGSRPQVMDLLQRETEGNVFFLVEVVRVLAEDAGRVGDVGRETLPDTVFAGGVQQVVQRRLSRVPESAQSMLKLAAVAGRQLDIQVLCLFAGVEMDFDNWLITCANLAVLDVQEGRWRFAHEKLRAGVLAGLPEDERPILHRKIAKAIEATYPGDEAQAVMLMEHWRVAGDSDKEAFYARIVGEQFWRISAFHDAIEAFERALTVTPEDDTASRATLLVSLGKSYEGLSDYSTSTQYLEEGLVLAQRVGDQETEIRALSVLSVVAGRCGEYANAQRRAEQALALSRKVGDQGGIALSLNSLGGNARNRGEYESARRYYEESLSIYREIGDQKGIAGCLINLGACASGQENYGAARRYYEESLTIYREIGNQRGIAVALNNLADIWRKSDTPDLEAAQRHYDESLEIFRKIGARYGVAACLDNLGFVTAEQGKVDAAWRYFCDALVESRAIRFAPLTLDAVSGISGLLARVGQRERAAELLGLVLHHPATVEETKREIEPLLTGLRDTLSADELEEAVERGKSLDLDAVVSEILA